jgi:hypothetical protein
VNWLTLEELLLIPSPEVEPFFWAIARGEQTIDEITDWLVTHIESWQEE